MFAVYAAGPNPDDPLASLVVGEAPGAGPARRLGTSKDLACES